MGRRKIEMEMVKDKSARQVTFSKRRAGLFKKANELVTLCACQIAIVVFSPGGKPYAFGHPDVPTVANRLLNDDKKPKLSKAKQAENRRREARIEKLNNELNDLLEKLEIEKKRGKELEKAMGITKNYKPKKTEDLNLEELTNFHGALKGIHEKVQTRMSELDASNSLLLLSQELPKE